MQHQSADEEDGNDREQHHLQSERAVRHHKLPSQLRVNFTSHPSNRPADRPAATVDDLTGQVKRAAIESGFDAVGICRSEVLRPERERYLSWLEEGRQGEMRWLTTEWARTASNPSDLLPGANSVICVALSYAGVPTLETPSRSGRIARYAVGADYHSLVTDRLAGLVRRIGPLGGSTRSFVDTAPTMDKALAARAGLGWQGRNTNILSRELGSFTFLGGILTDLDLTPDLPAQPGCGSCRACAVACPTGALNGDYTIDARLCISYLTIEHRGSIPRELRHLIGDWVFGCDICQDICPPVTDLQDHEFPELRSQRIAFTRAHMRQANVSSRPNSDGATRLV